MKPVSLNIVAAVINDYLNANRPIAEIAKKHGTNPISVSLYVSKFMAAFGSEQMQKSAMYVSDLPRPPIITTESELLEMGQSEFYSFTGLDPNNRWWVNPIN